MVKITTSQNIHLLYLDLLDYLKKVSPSPWGPREPSWLGGAVWGLDFQWEDSLQARASPRQSSPPGCQQVGP
jgi:hypothetical protein